jgi:hypothetical protein
VWRDLNGNGVQEAGEPGIPNVTLLLQDGNGQSLGITALTDANGYYQFTGLCAGDYKVVVLSGVPAELQPSPSFQGGDTAIDSNGSPASTTLTEDVSEDLTLDFGYWQPSALGDFVWHDLNANGVQEAGEPGIADVSVTLYTCDGMAVASTLTDANGLYLFSNLTPGCYYVAFGSPAGFTPSPANAGADDADSDSVGGVTGQYTLAAGETNLTVDAGFYNLAALGDFVWKDLDVDGVQDAGEPGIGGVTVTLHVCATTPAIATTSTDANGFYLFSNLTPGCYYVKFGTPAGYAPSPANQGNDALDSDAVGGVTGNYVLSSGETDLTVDAGFFRLAKLGDFVWKDLDSDGIQDAGEPGIGGVLVTLLRCDGTPTGLTQNTNGSGLYLFTDLMPGCYKVQFATPAGMTPSPANAGGDAVDSDSVGGVTGNYVLNAGDVNLTVDAGFFVPPPPICITTVFDFTKYGNSSVTGPAGNIRTFSSGGVNLKVSAFSETKPGGAFAPAYLGLYGHGFGVTDGSENGSSNTHVVDNNGRNNYVLFEFSQLVVVNQVMLDYIVGDSDVRVWIGNVPNVYSNHLSLNAGVLSSLAFTEVSLGGSSARTADVNAGEVFGNVVVVAAKPDETNDGFKLSKLGLGCVPAICETTGTFTFTGGSSVKGTAGNIRPFSTNGVNVNASAFSRKSDGTWNTAFLGAFSSGLGVTDGSEDGYNDTHKVDNIGRDNFVLLEFSEPVVVDRVFLDAVGADSDVSVWVGTRTNPYTNHLTLSDALLNSLTRGDNVTPDTTPGSRWADINDGQLAGNVVVIAAQIDDTTPEDAFKISKLAIGCVPEICKAEGTFYTTGNSATDGTSGNIRSFTAAGVGMKASAFSRKSDGTWNTAFLGAYSSGLGVTDGSEGDGSNNTHKLDNIGRNNFILLEFSQPVVFDRAFLDAVGADSDVSIWIGTRTDPYNNHLTLSDGLLNSLQQEDSVTPDVTSGSRWANVNSGKLLGNVVVIGGYEGDATPEDAFKVSKISIICP